MIKAIFAGSFDPLTLGHVNLIKRSAAICQHLIVAVGCNPAKGYLFSEEERIGLIRQSTSSLHNFFTSLSICSFQGLLVDFAKEVGAGLLIRGVRSTTDYEYETSLAQVNKHLAPEIETILLPADPILSIISSSAVKEIAKFGKSFSQFVSPVVEKALKEKFPTAAI